MKHSRFLWLIATGTLLFAIGLFVPASFNVMRLGLLLGGAGVVFIFYLLTLIDLLKSKSIRPSRKILWLILIVCVPVLGNLLYIIMLDSMTQRQTPRLQNF